MPLRILYTGILVLCITAFASPNECASVSVRTSGPIAPAEQPQIAAPHAEEAVIPAVEEKGLPEYNPFLSALFV